MEQHTKEPWKLITLGECHWEKNCPGHIDIEGADGNTVNPTPYLINSLDAVRIVACVNACADMADPETEITSLHKAAPELLEALKELVEVADLRGDSTLSHPADDPVLWTARMQTAWDEARAAIKAIK